jgi:hypothetical protein
MGWDESPNYPGVMLGDEAFDIAYEFLRRLREAYTAEFRRPPTVAEVTTLLQIALHVNGRETIAGLEEAEVTSVVVKTAKKKKDQPFAEGDVFLVPLDGRFAFGRILMIDKALGCLVEIFKRVTRNPVWLPGPDGERLFQPLWVHSDVLKSWRWTIIAKDEDYKAPADLTKLEYVNGTPSLGYSVVTVRNKIVRAASDKDMKSLPRYMISQGKQFEDKIRSQIDQ